MRPRSIPMRGREEATEFLTGYLIELSLSLDNVFVIALIFAYFRVPLEFQHRVLFWGVLGRCDARADDRVGAALISGSTGCCACFGAFLILTGIRMVFSGQEGVHPEKNRRPALALGLFPSFDEFDGQKFTSGWRISWP